MIEEYPFNLWYNKEEHISASLSIPSCLERVNVEMLKDVLLALLHLSGRGLTRTQIVKLLYFIDLEHIKKFGYPLSSASWIWDHHGPNDPQIVNTLDELIYERKLICHYNETPYITYFYEPIEGNKGQLQQKAFEFMKWVYSNRLNMYDLKLNATQLKDLSYQTSPMLRAQKKEARYQKLDFVEEMFSEYKANYYNVEEESDMLAELLAEKLNKCPKTAAEIKDLEIKEIVASQKIEGIDCKYDDVEKLYYKVAEKFKLEMMKKEDDLIASLQGY